MMQQFADFIIEMKAVPEEGGTLLDNSVILCGNHMQDGSNHDASKIPWVLAGNGGRLLQRPASARPARASRSTAS